LTKENKTVDCQGQGQGQLHLHSGTMWAHRKSRVAEHLGGWIAEDRSFPPGDGALGKWLSAGLTSMNQQSQLNTTTHE